MTEQTIKIEKTDFLYVTRPQALPPKPVRIEMIPCSQTKPDL